MKTLYIFVAILIASIAGALVGGRSSKTAFLFLTGALSVYGVIRLLH